MPHLAIIRFIPFISEYVKHAPRYLLTPNEIGDTDTVRTYMYKVGLGLIYFHWSEVPNRRFGADVTVVVVNVDI